MSKKEKEIEAKPFDGFSILKGEFRTPPTESEVESDIETEDPTVIKETVDEMSDDEKARLAKGDEALKAVIEKQANASSKKTETVVEEETTEEVEGETKEDNAIKAFAKALAEKSIIDFDDTDPDFKGDEEGLETLIDKTVKNRINKWAEALPDDFAKMLNFVENGGSPKQFLEVYYGNHSWDTYKIDDNEEAQKLVLRESMKADYSPEDIEDIITEWSDNGSLEKRAKPALAKLQKQEAEQKAQLIEQQKAEVEKHKAAQKEYWENFKKDIYSKEDIKGFKLTPKVKDNLWQFMTVVDKKSGKTEYEKAIQAEKDAALLFAYFAMNKFDTNKLERQVESKVSKTYSSMFKNYDKNTKEKISGGGSPQYKDENPFEAFKSK